MARRVVVEIVGDSSKLERAFVRSERSAKSFGRNVERAGRGATIATVGFHGLGRAVASTSAAFLGGYGLAAAAKAAFGEMMKGQAVTADTIAALKSTGSVAGVTAKEVENLGTSLQQLSGYDDEAIRSAENLILTFTNVRNVAGKGNDVFNQAIRSVLDLSRRFDQDLSTSAVQLGKALQDPIRGVTALRRAGVSFSTQQQRLITRLVNTGRLLEAQKILLREVRTETGGAAAAYGKTLAGQLDILQGNLENMGGELANVLNPAIKKLAERFNDWLANPKNKTQVIDDFTTAMHDLGVAAEGAATAFGHLKNAYDKLPDFGKKGLMDTRFGRWLSDTYDLDKIFGKGMLQDAGGGGNFPTRPFRPPGLQGPVKRGAAAPGIDLTPKPQGVTAAQRNRWFDAAIARRLNRLQDLSLRGQQEELKAIAATVRGRLAVTKDKTRQLTLEDQILDVQREQRSVQQQITDQIKAGNQALKDRAEAIKSALLERLQQRQTDVLNQRALRDAKERLRIARLLGGVRGARGARENLADVRFDILTARLSRAPATLTKGGQFALGNVITINVHGVTDPDKVATKVAEVLKKRDRRTSSSNRGPAAGAATGSQ